jgi:hypothetical protein
VGRFHHVATRLSMIGALALLIGTSLVAGVIVQSLTSSAYADTAPYEIFCPGTPVGNLVLNDVTVTGTMSPAAPSAGQQFNLANVQEEGVIPAAVAQQAEAIGLTSLTGTISGTVDATGATPASIPTGAVAFNIPIPDPIPSAGMTLDVPSPPATVGPFTATGTDVTLSMDSGIDITFNDGPAAGLLDFHCSSYANDSIPQSGFTETTPPGLTISPVIATTGPSTPPAPPAVTGPYELYCPHTPVGDLVLNDVVTTASISPQNLSAGEQFSVTGYQTDIPLPAGLVSAAAGLGNSSFNGLATSAVDAYGATTDQASTGSMAFDVSIPSPPPSSTLGVDFPTSPTTVGPFTATGGPITIAQDESTMVVAALSSKAFTMSCTAYANDSVSTSGSTGTAPTGPPIRPVLAVASASGTTPTTTTVPTPPSQTTSPTGPYELYCPQTPVGNIVLNDTVTSATISPSTLVQGQQFQLSGLQTQFSIPQAVAQQAEGLGLTEISGDASVFLDTTGISGFGGFSPPIPVANPGGPDQIPFPDEFGDEVDMPFDVTLPNPVPATGVQFVAAPGAGSTSLTALGGPISIDVGSINLNVSEFGDNFGFFCTTFPNDSEPTGLTITGPEVSPIEPAIATGNATIPPPPPVGPGGVGPYELYCPGTPVGNIALNDVTTTATLSPPDPSPGEQFNVTNYQNQVPLPDSIVSAAAALGNPSIAGTATAAIDASGASPSSLQTGLLSFDAPIPSPVPASGVTLTVPTTPETVGMFTASSSSITIAQNADINLTLVISGSNLVLDCTAFPDNSAPTGIVQTAPDVSPISPVIVTAGPATTSPPTTPPTTPTTPPTTPPSGGTPGPYELYCPGTPVGNIVLNNVTTSGKLSPPDPSPGDQFSVEGFQTDLSIPSSIVAAAAALGNSAITGDAVVKVDADGATPASLSSGPITINAPIPSPVPSSGLTLNLPSPPGTVGPFTATGNTVTLTVDPAISLALTVSGSTLDLTCKPYANNSASTGIVSSAPNGSAISPIIATSSTTGTVPPPVTVPPVTVPITTVTTAPPTTITIPPSSTVAEITQAFNTVFDPTASIADKVAAIQDGSAVETSLNDALSSSLASSLGGAKIDAVSLPDDSQCAATGLPSPCASVQYDILSSSGTALLPDNNGSAVTVNGTWVVSTDTVCNLLDLFYQAEGRTGTPPGCPSTPPTTLPTVTVGPPGSGFPTPTTVVGTGVGFSSSTTQPQDPTGADPAPAANGSGTTDPAPGSATTASPDPSGTVSATTAPAGADPPDPPSGAAPIVEASSGALAFTGLGDIAQWLAVVGGALIILGFVLLTMVDAPRRLLYQLTQGGGAGRTARWLSRR